MKEVHDPNGPSQLHKREGCPGSGRQEEIIRAAQAGTFVGEMMERSEAAMTGRRLHEDIADCIKSEVRPSLERYPAYEPETIDALQTCYDYADKLIHEGGPDALVLVETRLDLADLGIPQGGTIDLAVVRPGDSFFLVDWKFGGLPVKTPRWNRQMQAYAIGLVNAYGCVNGGWAAVCQPASNVPLKTDRFSAEELTECAGAIRTIVARANDPQAPLIPGDHCTLCRARDNCPARRALAEATIAGKAAPTLATVRGMEPARRLDFYERLKLAKAWVEGAIGEVENAVIDGKLEIPGLMVGEGRKSREWMSEGHAIEALREVGIPPEDAYKRTIISPAEVEKRVGKKRALALRNIILSVPGKPRVVRCGTSGAIED